jgi:hypothetical protein
MATPHWRDLGYLTPDAPECQQDVWALCARLQGHLATLLDELALRTAEPTWAAVLTDAAGAARALREALLDASGAAAVERLAHDEALIEFEGSLEEVLHSGHVPALIVTGHVVLGELAVLPARLLMDTAGPHARPLAARVAGSEAHRPLARLFAATNPAPAELENLRRMLRHLDALLYAIYATWRQTFHVLGVDGELLQEEAAAVVRAARHTLGLKVTAKDLEGLRA